MSGSPIVCCVCHLPALGFKHFADSGWACRSCVMSADSIVVVYRINGFRFVEIQKRATKEKAPSVVAESA